MNAKRELIKHLGTNLTLKCATITKGYEFDYENQSVINLSVNYTPQEYEDFLNKIDFIYDDGYGGQYLHGTLWHTDESWSERGEYDGSEWWEHKTNPVIPDCLL